MSPEPALAAAQAVAREHGVACEGLEPFLEAHALYATVWQAYVSGG